MFSVINFATTGFYLKTIYTTSPNETIAEQHWYTKAPWTWSDKLKATCQAQNLPIGYQFFTTNLGLSYTLDSVTQYNKATNQTVHLPSLPYLNQTLEDCQIDQVVLYMRKNDQSENGHSAWWSWGDSTGAATAHCTVSTAVGLVNASFAATYSSSPKQYSYVIQDNYTEQSSMWWGTRLLNLYWSSTLFQMAGALYPDLDNTNWTTTPIWTKGQITFTPNKTDDIKAYEFFNLQYYFIAGDSSIRNYADPDLSNMYNYDGLAYTGPLTEGLSWAKVMTSTILTDLGQSKLPNLLLDEKLLQWILQYPDDEIRQGLDPYSCDYENDGNCYQDWVNFGGIAAPGVNPDVSQDQQKPMNQSYDAYKSLMGPLGTKKTTIFSQYACSIPVRKDGGTLFLSILIADLVFLQALWAILTLVAGAIVSKSDGYAMACQTHVRGGNDYGMVGMEQPRSNGVEYIGGYNESQQKLVPTGQSVEVSPDPNWMGRSMNR